MKLVPCGMCASVRVLSRVTHACTDVARETRACARAHTFEKANCSHSRSCWLAFRNSCEFALGVPRLARVKQQPGVLHDRTTLRGFRSCCIAGWGGGGEPATGYGNVCMQHACRRQHWCVTFLDSPCMTWTSAVWLAQAPPRMNQQQNSCGRPIKTCGTSAARALLQTHIKSMVGKGAALAKSSCAS